MSLKLSKTNTPAYEYYSEGDGSDPVSRSVTVAAGGGSVTSSVLTAYLVATIYNYTGIAMTIANEQAGVNWQLSADNSTWEESLDSTDLPAMDALSADQVKTVYIRAVVLDSTATGIYTTPDISITATENPS